MLFLKTSKRYYVVGVHTSPWGRATCLYFCALFPGAFNGVCLSQKTIPWGVPVVDPQGSK